MTIYSQHANRGKTQILATYQGPEGVVSATVTSVGDSALAKPITDAFNRVSALATVPLSVYDRRNGSVEDYPTKHLVALTDRGSRAELLSGTHSLWYEYVCLELHQALANLDDALLAVPEPVRIAVNAELEAEARGLFEAVAEDPEGGFLPDTESQRLWDVDHPFVVHDGGTGVLSDRARRQLDSLEKGVTSKERVKAVADMRVLATAFSRCSGVRGHVDHTYPEIFAEPFDADRYYLSVHAPQPGDSSADTWEIEIGRWEPDDPSEEDADDYSSATGSSMIRCEQPTAPDADELADLLNRLDQEPQQLTEWAKTSVGAPLAGTRFVVTKAYDD
ncbi:hypothetical protein K7472_17340 [Streptomyces sp. PTM05]|uniref:Uncharacterized protein n=1 Tax=Streptantibioticus parmotrematis TaxID=2873249 RepID=A0ABS7QTU8_9ACTN|nr:hypothetical protein [Streptantibioticus parmotrematis]MBY8886617.1 hypothetical protein [Streptantibioticus parmotrematis]